MVTFDSSYRQRGGDRQKGGMEGREITILDFKGTSYQELYTNRKRNTRTQGTLVILYWASLCDDDGYIRSALRVRQR